MKEIYKAEDTPLTRLVGRYVNNLIDYTTFERAVKELYSDKEEHKPTSKEFDLEAAKAGKPVCTRDGRKARIICFDRENEQPIVALIKDDEEEYIDTFFNNGHSVSKINEVAGDLMMLPEKKEGWAKVRKDINLYDTKEEADRKMIGNDEYVTAKVCWEE